MTERHVEGIANRILLERIFQRELHIPATLLRAGDAYKRLKGEILTEGKSVTAGMEGKIWDRAVTENNDLQIEDLKNEKLQSMRRLPLHEERSPVTGAPMLSRG